MSAAALPPAELFGQIDIYLFDQLLKGRITPDMRVLDAGCGSGRNIVYLLRMGCDVCAVDESGEAVADTLAIARSIRPDINSENFRVATIAALPFDDGAFDVVLAIAVLHFAHDRAHLDRMVGELWRVLKPGGLLFARLASSIGIEDYVTPLGDRRYRLPDGSERYLVDEAELTRLTDLLGGALADPVKTTNVENRRAMTTWTVRK